MPEITMDAVIENQPKVIAFVEEALEEIGCPIKFITQSNIAVDEIFSNIMLYAYPPHIGPVTVKVEKLENGASITFIDSGIPYDPLKKEDPDVSLSAEERAIGGLGIFMVKKMMDDVLYEYKDKQNILTLIKNF